MLFSSKQSYLGVDIGTASIKIVELKNEGGRAKLTTYGFTEEATDIVRSSSQEMEEKIIALIKKVCERAKTTTKKTVAALPSFSVFSSIISLPQMSKKDLTQAVTWEAKKFVPMPIEEMVLDWKVLEERAKELKAEHKKESFAQKQKTSPLISQVKPSFEIPNPLSSPATESKVTPEVKKNIKILLTAAPKNLVERYIRIFKGTQLEFLSLETESLALERSLIGGDPTPIMVVDIGALTSDIAIFEKGIPVLNRSVDVGGLTLTHGIASRLQVSFERAEQFKRDIGFTPSRENSILRTIEATFSPLINELKYCFDLYLSQEGSSRIEKIILTGGSSFLPNFDSYLSRLLDIKVYIGDPWARVIYPVELKPVLEEIGPRFSVAIGLAMREIE